jgi:hypothetical protein
MVPSIFTPALVKESSLLAEGDEGQMKTASGVKRAAWLLASFQSRLKLYCLCRVPLLDERQDERRPAVRDVGGSDAELRERLVLGSPRRQKLVGVMMAVQGDGDLPKVVLALRSRRRLAHFLHRGEQESDENGDDGDHHQQLDQGKASSR